MTDENLKWKIVPSSLIFIGQTRPRFKLTWICLRFWLCLKNDILKISEKKWVLVLTLFFRYRNWEHFSKHQKSCGTFTWMMWDSTMWSIKFVEYVYEHVEQRHMEHGIARCGAAGCGAILCGAASCEIKECGATCAVSATCGGSTGLPPPPPKKKKKNFYETNFASQILFQYENYQTQ